MIQFEGRLTTCSAGYGLAGSGRSMDPGMDPPGGADRHANRVWPGRLPRRSWIWPAVGLVFAGWAMAGEGAPGAGWPNSQDQVAAATSDQRIADLQAKEYTKRQAATLALSQMEFGQLVDLLPLLTAADAELAWRAREIFVQQGVRGGAQEVRRIGLMFKLLTAAGHPEFRLDAENFQTWVESVRVSELLQKMQQMDGLQMTEGLRFVGRNVGGIGGNVLRIQGGAIVIGADELRNNIVIEGWNDPPDQPRRVDPFRRPIAQRTDEQAAENLEQGNSPPPPELSAFADPAQRSASVQRELPGWLQQCLLNSDLEFEALEQSLRDSGVIQAETMPADGMVTHYEIWVTRPLNEADLTVLADFLQNRISLSLVLSEITLDTRWQNLLSAAAEAGKLQMLNTIKCGYDLTVYRELNRLTKAGKLGYWTTQGRAMLGIRASNLAIDRMTSGEFGGAEVGDVTPSSAAEVAGIRSGDLITHVNESKVENFEELRKIVSAFDVGQSIQVSVTRRGSPDPLILEVRLMEHTQ